MRSGSALVLKPQLRHRIGPRPHGVHAHNVVSRSVDLASPYALHGGCLCVEAIEPAFANG
jgi:hypothetical protein